MRCLVWSGLLVAILVGLGSTSNAQIRQRFVQPVEVQLTPEIDRSVQKALDDATSLIDEKKYLHAVVRLQAVLDHSEDYFLEKDFRSRTLPQTSVREQVRQIMSELPAEGRAAYESVVGTKAQDLLKQGLSTNDLELITQVASRYQMTSAGFDALQFLASRAFDHDLRLEAALLCDAMSNHPHAEGALKRSLALQAAYAWYLAGQSERAMNSLNRLVEERGPWQMGGRELDPLPNISDAPRWLKGHFGQVASISTPLVSTWALPRGGLTGNESANATFPIGGGLWKVSPRKHLRFLADKEANQHRIDAFDELTRQIEKTMRDNNRLCQPAVVPLIIGNTVVYRTLNDITAVDLKTGQLLWRSSTTDGMLAWLFQSSLAMSENISSSSLLTFRGYLRFKLFRDQLSSSLSSDGKHVFAIEESDSQFSPLLPRSRMPFGAPLMADPSNKLVAYELSGGRLLWEVGGQSGTPPAELSGIFFLGPPVPSAGRLYCLAESKSELRLISLVPDAKSARLEWSQALINTEQGIFVAARRFAGLIPAIAEGVAVCPTANGSLVAFDLVQRQLRWGYSYDSTSRRNMQGGSDFLSEEEEGRWLDGGPIISNGYVIVTPRDSTELHCVNLVDGTLNWKRPREQNLYVAGVLHDRVVVIGRTQIVAYSLADGSEVWSEPIEIPEPSGRGVRIESQYLLPLSTGEIATIDLSTGRILGQSRMSEGGIPGNLAVGSGALVSFGVDEIVGFRPLSEIEEQISRLLTTNPADAEALALRGELRLHRGQEDDALRDLRQALQSRPTEQVKRVLAETLLSRMRTDPKEVLRSAAELEALTDDPRQQVEFRRLYAKTLSDNGDHLGAITQLIRLGMSSAIPDQMMAIGPGHFVSLAQIVRTQLFEIYEDADPAQRESIGPAFSREIDAALGQPDREERVSRFIKLTMGHPAADSVLLKLAESADRLMDDLTRTGLLERLARSKNKTIAVNAITGLVNRLLAANAPREALPWIHEMRSRYPQDPGRDGRTGGQLGQEWLNRLEVRSSQSSDEWPKGAIRVDRINEETTQASYPVEVVTRVGHVFDGWTFETDALVTQLTARDSELNVVWRLPLANPSDEFRVQPTQLHIRGRRLALSAGMWLGVMESADLSHPPKILVDFSMRPQTLSLSRSIEPVAERRMLPNGRRFQLISDARGAAGYVVGLSDDAVLYQLDNRLYAASVENGRILWSRTGPQFAKSDATVDTHVVLNTATNGATLLRTLDGTIDQRHQGSPNDTILWFQGTMRLCQRAVGVDQREFEMRNLDGDQVLWQTQHPAGSLPCLILNDEFAVLEPNGRLTIFNMATGQQKMTAELPVKPQKGPGVIAIQRLPDFYLVIAGVSPRITENRRILPLNIATARDFGTGREFGPFSSSFTVDGVVCSIARADGTVQWSTPVTDLAYDTTQPWSLPVLVLASYQSEVDQFTGFAQSRKLSVLILDKRTGAKVYQTLEAVTPEATARIGRGVQFNPMIKDHALGIDFYNWQLNLKFAPK